MRRSAKPWLITAAVLVAVGLIMFVGVMTMSHWDFSKLNTAKYVSSTYPVDEKFHDISIRTITADIRFVPSDDDACRVECHELEKIPHSVKVEDGTLMISSVDNRSWYDHIGISFRSPKVTVYLPESSYGKVSVNNTTGDLDIPKDFTFESLDAALTTGAADISASVSKDIQARVTTGAVTLSDVTCDNLTISGSTGSTTLKNVIAEGTMSIKRTTGSISFDGCDASEINVKTTTGSVNGTLLSEKVFSAKSTTGSVDVPATTGGGRCVIETTTGSISIRIR